MKVDLEPVRGHEQGSYGTFLIVSVDTFNQGPQELVTGCPVTYTTKALRSRVTVHPPEGGVDAPGQVVCDQIRTISQERIGRLCGMVKHETMQAVEERIRIVLGL